MNMPPETKTCPKECRIAFGPGVTTCAYYPPVYDKNGNNINPDRNTTSGNCSCMACGKAWTYSTQLDVTTYKEMT